MAIVALDGDSCQLSFEVVFVSESSGLDFGDKTVEKGDEVDGRICVADTWVLEVGEGGVELGEFFDVLYCGDGGVFVDGDGA
jgi:hypothetical protein